MCLWISRYVYALYVLNIRWADCVAEDDPDAGEFMVQCETCKVWQHGLCMGYEAEEQLPDDDYHCEQCRPDLHKELVKFVSLTPPYGGFLTTEIPLVGNNRSA
jgi:hypothetical protein